MKKLVLVIFSLLYITSAQTYYVSTTGSDKLGDGTINNPWKTITFALCNLDTLTNEIKTINISGGIYSDITNGEVYPLNLVSNIILSGEDASSTILDATSDSLEGLPRRVVNCMNIDNVRIEKLTITNGLALMDSIGNYAIGGGIYLKNSNKMIIWKNIIKENESIDITGYGANGGGIAVEECSNVIIDENEILNNYTFADGCNGGGIFINNSTVLIRNNLIQNNNTFGQFGSAGGGIAVGYSNLPTYIVDNIITSNKAAVLGGGVYISGPGIVARNTIKENIVGEYFFQIGYGGGIAATEDPIIGNGVKNCNNIFDNIGEEINPLGNQMITFNTLDTIDARFNYFGSNINPYDSKEISGMFKLSPMVKNLYYPDSANLLISPSPLVIDTLYMFGNVQSDVVFYNISNSLLDSIIIYNITSKCGLVSISKNNLVIPPISESSTTITFNVNEILSQSDTIIVNTNIGEFLITFFILGEDSISGLHNDNELLAKYSLFHNYPNPFNPSTHIQYSISSRQFVTLKVFDVLGKEIAILVNEEKPAGSYEIEFNSVETLHATSLPSGVYFYQLSAGDYIETKKMILLK
jgi:hypothetical protein